MMRRIVVGLAVAVASLTAAGASAALSPGVHSSKITGAGPAALSGPAFGIVRNGVAAVAGTTTIAGNKITFRDITGPFRCTGAQGTGAYTRSLKGKRLTLKPVREPCAGRKSILTHRFTKLG